MKGKSGESHGDSRLQDGHGIDSGTFCSLNLNPDEHFNSLSFSGLPERERTSRAAFRNGANTQTVVKLEARGGLFIIRKSLISLVSP